MKDKQDTQHILGLALNASGLENIDFCFGHDSHSPATVGVGIDSGRDYLLSCGVKSITVLTRKSGKLNREQRSLN